MDPVQQRLAMPHVTVVADTVPDCTVRYAHRRVVCKDVDGCVQQGW
jgi:hypothetical protein